MQILIFTSGKMRNSMAYFVDKKWGKNLLFSFFFVHTHTHTHINHCNIYARNILILFLLRKSLAEFFLPKKENNNGREKHLFSSHNLHKTEI